MGLLIILLTLVLLFGVVAFRGAPYVPSMKRYAAQALDDLCAISDKDVLVDVGSGDGVILRLAATRGARAIGYELNPLLMLVSRMLSRRSHLVEVRLADFWLVDLPKETTIVYAFSVGRDMEKLSAKLQKTANDARHPVRLVTYGHTIASLEAAKKTNSHFLYVFEPKS